MSLPTDLYKKKKSNSYFFSLLFLVSTIVLTGALYLYNGKIDKDIDDINVKIKEVNSLIDNIKEDEKLQIYSLIESNKKSLEALEHRSQIPDYIEHYRDIGEKYKIDLNSFSYSAGKISTSVNFNQENEVTYLRVVNFIKNYRQSQDSLFDLNFIKSVKGHDVISFGIGLKLKDPVKKPVIEEQKKEEEKNEKETPKEEIKKVVKEK